VVKGLEVVYDIGQAFFSASWAPGERLELAKTRFFKADLAQEAVRSGRGTMKFISAHLIEQSLIPV